ncbi:hypothetical protein LSH36_1350g00020 [Paralvinella palmiformis]|uniref:Uncharacterized protein n=1 Tax=Paralvinella palmiformis TaxID=53620 RepID=A0AAD9IUQ5_9ANNE|nr:hypothetical protein LSH36_1350g00020 [Paralvinella palmiformis]
MASGDAFSAGPVVKYVDWAAGHFQLERYAQRYRLQASYAKMRRVAAESPPSAQPEDLTVSTSGNANRSRDDDGYDEEAPIDEDEGEDPEDCSKLRKSTSELKFSIANILGNVGGDKRKNSKMADQGSLSPIRDSSASPEADVDIVAADPERSMTATTTDKETSGDEKVPDGLAPDGERFSWLQCTRYKPPKLPSKS